MNTRLKRRAVLSLLGGAAVSPLLRSRAAHAQATRRIGLLATSAESDTEGQQRIAAFREALAKLGWTDPRNVRFDVRWSAADAERMRAHAAALAGSAPDVIFASGTSALTVLQRATRTIPIVFAQVADPVANGFVTNLARPGGNITGFALPERTIGAKRLELLKQIAPGVARVALVFDPASRTGPSYLTELEPAAPMFEVTVAGAAVRNAAEIESTIAAAARASGGGLIVVASPATTMHRDLIVKLAATHRLPAVYPFRYFVADGGLASYGVDNIDSHRRAAGYVDRILKGEKPGDLPVQQADKYELVINLKAAKALGLDPPVTLLARTDEVIE